MGETAKNILGWFVLIVCVTTMLSLTYASIKVATLARRAELYLKVCVMSLKVSEAREERANKTYKNVVVAAKEAKDAAKDAAVKAEIKGEEIKQAVREEIQQIKTTGTGPGDSHLGLEPSGR